MGAQSSAVLGAGAQGLLVPGGNSGFEVTMLADYLTSGPDLSLLPVLAPDLSRAAVAGHSFLTLAYTKFHVGSPAPQAQTGP